MTDAEIHDRIIALFEQLPRDQREAVLGKLRKNLGFTPEQIESAIPARRFLPRLSDDRSATPH